MGAKAFPSLSLDPGEKTGGIASFTPKKSMFCGEKRRKRKIKCKLTKNTSARRKVSRKHERLTVVVLQLKQQVVGSFSGIPEIEKEL